MHGRPSLNLLDMIRNDLKVKRKKISNSLRSISDFEDLRAIALDRVKGVDHSKKSLSRFHLNMFYLSQLRSS